MPFLGWSYPGSAYSEAHWISSILRARVSTSASEQRAGRHKLLRRMYSGVIGLLSYPVLRTAYPKIGCMLYWLLLWPFARHNHNACNGIFVDRWSTAIAARYYGLPFVHLRYLDAMLKPSLSYALQLPEHRLRE